MTMTKITMAKMTIMIMTTMTMKKMRVNTAKFLKTRFPTKKLYLAWQVVHHKFELIGRDTT